MTFFSIIVPIYKVEKYLDECVQSVLSQSFADYECILVDDGSPDNCPIMCDEYSEKYKQIKAIHKENGGLSDARNAGILQASGEYIILLDSDDKFADNEALKNLFDNIQKYKTNVVVNVNLLTFTDSGDILLKDGYNKNITIASSKEIYDEFCRTYRSTVFAGCVFVLNRIHLLKNDLFFKKGILHEDEHWMPRVLFTTQQISVNHSPFYAYRIGRDGSITASFSPKKLYDILIIADDLLELSKDEKKYTIHGCKVMLQRAKMFCDDVYSKCDEINNKDGKECKKISRALIAKQKKLYKKFKLLNLLKKWLSKEKLYV